MVRGAILLVAVGVGLPIGGCLAVDLVTFAVCAPDFAIRDAIAIAAIAALVLGVSIWGLLRSLRGCFAFRPRPKALAVTACVATLVLWQLALLLDAGYASRWGGWIYLNSSTVEVGYEPSPRYTGLRSFEFRDFPPLASWDRDASHVEEPNDRIARSSSNPAVAILRDLRRRCSMRLRQVPYAVIRLLSFLRLQLDWKRIGNLPGMWLYGQCCIAGC